VNKKAVKKGLKKVVSKVANKVNKKAIKKGLKKVVSKVANKAVIGVLVLALVLAGALGAYAFHLSGKISTLHNELKGVAIKIDEMEQSVIDASKLYQKVSQSIVAISDGEKVLGSGFAFDTGGYILTPQHVVKGQNQIYIITPDGHTSLASIVGVCEYSDIAVLKQSLPIPALTLVDSATVEVGEPVIVIGNPFDLPGTITSGIVSQTNRQVKYDLVPGGVTNIIQFDAAINSGNSGSPLLNSKGEVIGMVVARIDPKLGDGVYYAVSSNKLKVVAPSLIERGYFDYPWLGVEITDLTPETAITRNLETVNGALVKTVIPATPAEAAGIKVDDIIVAINGTPVQEVADLTCYLGEHASPGDEVTLTLLRDGTKIELPIKVAKR
jgi:S1-C subfamily serine protease